MKPKKNANGIVFSWMFLLLIKFHNIESLQLSTGWKQLLKEENNTANDDKLPGPRSGSSVWMDKNHRAWLFGGRGLSPSHDNKTQLYIDLWSYSIQEGKWQVRVSQHLNCTDSCASMSIGRQFSTMCGITGKNVVVFGGQMANEEKSLVATSQMLVWNSSSLSGQWLTKQCTSSKRELCPSARYDALVWCTEEKDSGHMTVIGGRDSMGRLLTDSWKLDLKMLSWTKLTPPATGCSWMAPDNSPTPITTNTNELSQLALVWVSLDGQGGYIMCDHRQPSNQSDENTNVQLWMKKTYNDTWRLVTESGRDSMTWPGGHIHGDTCTDTDGNLWLFGGQSQIGGSGYLNNDVWAFNVSSDTWLKVELPPEDATEPSQRHRAASWCQQDSMFIYGGSSCDDSNDISADCIQDDFWILNMSVTRRTENFFPRQPQPRVTPISKPGLKSTSFSLPNTMNTLPSPVSSSTKMTTTTITPVMTKTTIIPKMTKTKASTKDTVPMPSMNGSTGASLKLDAVRDRDAQDPHVSISRHDPILGAESPSDHGAYGSVIFFGISLSIFAAFGVVLFFRRCVSCPPRENMLLKEAPPVRYTVIPDESYTI